MDCPSCGFPDCTAITEPDENNQVEYRCNKCGERFTDDAE